MKSIIKVAAIQLDAGPMPLAGRLRCAETMLAQVTAQSADLAVLPELFNTGYGYTDQNYSLAEPIGGATHRWMLDLAARHQIFLAGAILIRDAGEIYDSLLLVSPQGNTWRYDKSYPWGWERAYFRPGRHPHIADTPLARIGMLICWDTAHRNLWRAYAGKVDLIIASSCPPDVTNPLYSLPNGTCISAGEISPYLKPLVGCGHLIFNQMLSEQAAWLGVPLVNAMGCGQITTPIPRVWMLLLAVLPQRPQLMRYLRHINALRMTCKLLPGTKVLSPGGATLVELPPNSGEAFITTEVSLPAQTSSPRMPQPPSPLPSLAYILSDRLLPGMMRAVYERGKRSIIPTPPA